MSWTRTHLRIAELGCLASTPLEDWREKSVRCTIIEEYSSHLDAGELQTATHSIILWLEPLKPSSRRSYCERSFKLLFVCLKTENIENKLTLFQERCPWREMHQRKDWPSSVFPSEPSCNPCRPNVGHVCGFYACEQFGFRVVYLEMNKQASVSWWR